MTLKNALVYFQKGRALQWPWACTQEAVAAFEKTLALKPRYSEARMRKGISLFSLGRFAEAIRGF